MESYSVDVPLISSATGVLTQIYPDWCTAGTAYAAGAEIRLPVDGILHEMTVYPLDAVGGIIEVYDIAGEYSGTNDVNTSNTMTNAYLTSQLNRERVKAKLIWKQEFKGDPGLTTKKFTQRTKFNFGLAVRIYTTATITNEQVTLNISSEGLYRKTVV